MTTESRSIGTPPTDEEPYNDSIEAYEDMTEQIAERDRRIEKLELGLMAIGKMRPGPDTDFSQLAALAVTVAEMTLKPVPITDREIQASFACPHVDRHTLEARIAQLERQRELAANTIQDALDYIRQHPYALDRDTVVQELHEAMAADEAIDG